MTKSVAEERLAALKLDQAEELEDLETADEKRKSHMATLKARRLEKEAAERAAEAADPKPKRKTKKKT